MEDLPYSASDIRVSVCEPGYDMVRAALMGFDVRRDGHFFFCTHTRPEWLCVHPSPYLMDIRTLSPKIMRTERKALHIPCRLCLSGMVLSHRGALSLSR